MDNSNAETVYTGGTQTFTLTAGYHAITIAHEEFGGGQSVYANIQGPAGSGLTTNQNIPNSILANGVLATTYSSSSALQNVTLTANSTIDVQQALEAELGTLTMPAGMTLNTTGNGVRFTSALLDFGGTDTFNINGTSFAPGPMSDGGQATTFVKTGSGSFLLDQVSNSLAATTFQVNDGKLMIVSAGNGFAAQGGAAINLAGTPTAPGGLQLATAGSTPITYDLAAQNVTIAANQSLDFSAGMDFSGQGGESAAGPSTWPTALAD